MTHGGSPQAASRRTARLALTPNAVSSLGLLNSIVSDAAGGFVSVLIGLCDLATFFLCCLPSIGLVERRGEGDIGDAIALDGRKDRIDGRRHCDNRNLPRRSAGEHANSRGAVHSIFHLRAWPGFHERFKRRARSAWSNPVRTSASSG